MKGSLKMFIPVLLTTILLIANSAYASELVGKLTKISDQQFLFPAISSDGRDIFYLDCRGDKPFGFYRMNLATKKATRISRAMDTPNWVSWPTTCRQVIISIIYNRYIFEKYHSPFARPGTKDGVLTHWLYDFPSQKLTFLLSTEKFLDWSPDGREIVYLDKPPGSSGQTKAQYSADKIIIVERTFELLRIKIVDIVTGQEQKLICPELEQLRWAALSGNVEGGPSSRKYPVLDFIWDPSSRSFYINKPNGEKKGLYHLTLQPK